MYFELMTWPTSTTVGVLMALALGGCGYNDLQRQDEGIKAAWSEVLNQYKRRADLIPNLVSTVQGYASQEKDVLIGVTNARARATSVQLPPDARFAIEVHEPFRRGVVATRETLPASPSATPWPAS